MQELVVELPKLLKDQIAKRYIFNERGLVIENFSHPQQNIEIPIHTIHSFRFGVNWIRGSHFIIGRQYFFELRDSDNHIISIKFSSYYGIRKNTYHEIYLKIINVVWDHYFIYQFNYYADKYREGNSFDLNNINFNKDGIQWHKKERLPWSTVGLSSYATYFVIYDTTDSKCNLSFKYINEWNAYLLKAVLEGIIKGLKSLNSISD